MIKILKPGRAQIGVCSKCACEFSYEEEDVKRCLGIRFIDCPCCGNEVDIMFDTKRIFK